MSMQATIMIIFVASLLILFGIIIILGYIAWGLIKYIVEQQEDRRDEYESEIDWYKEVIETQNQIIERLGNKDSK